MKTKTIASLCILCFTIGAGLSYKVSTNYANAVWSASVNEQNLTIEKALRVAERLATEKIQRQNQLARTLEVMYVETQTQLDEVRADNRRLTTEFGMRDPGQRGRGATTESETSGTTSCPTSGTTEARLSNEAEEFLLSFSRDADQAAQYAQTCYQWIRGLEKAQ